MRLAPAAIVLAAACSSPAPSPAVKVAPAPPAAGADRARVVVFHGMCDASAAVEIGPDTFLVADDEDNVLRTFHGARGGRAVDGVDMSRALGLEPKGKYHDRWPELDLEAGTRIGDRAYWLTSHGRNSKAKLKPERMRFFSTTIPGATPLALVGHPYESLVDDLVADPRFAGFGLAAAAERAPKAEGGFNLEGMTATPDGTLLLGFRNPVPEGLALLFEVRAPAALFDGDDRAALGDPIRLDLGGLGVRALTWWHGAYLIVAGTPGSGGTSRLFRWDGHSAPQPIDVALDGFNPEGTFTPEHGDDIMLLSDDGTVEIDGVPCKELRDPAARRFRGLWLRLPAA
jgi:hypothetical protein